MKKKDVQLMAAVMVLALLVWLIQRLVISSEGDMIRVMRDGSWIGTYSLEKQAEIAFTDEQGGRNILVIQDGEAYMKEADCPDGLCMKQKPISRKGESIICLPHRLVIEVIQGEETATDAVTG